MVGGTLSEGINFSDDLGRCVVVFGVPYPNTESYEMKRQMRDNPDYYENLTMRGVNQCVGRVIRHKDDYGLLVLVDARFGRLRPKVSGWLLERISVTNEDLI